MLSSLYSTFALFKCISKASKVPAPLIFVIPFEKLNPVEVSVPSDSFPVSFEPEFKTKLLFPSKKKSPDKKFEPSLFTLLILVLLPKDILLFVKVGFVISILEGVAPKIPLTETEALSKVEKYFEFVPSLVN